MTNAQNIKKYWNEQAKMFGREAKATTQDIYMRDIEIDYITTFLSSFREPLMVLDIGCGNGFSTFQYKAKVGWHTYVGGDYSEGMIEAANAELKKRQLSEGIEFNVIDVLNLSKLNNKYDIIISDRCLINLGGAKNRKKALWEIAACLHQGGRYLMIENFIEGHSELNRLREYLDIPEISVRWHNSFFSIKELKDSVKHIFKIDNFENISSLYYLVTRVVYSKLCEMEGREPDYEHPIYKVASQLPPTDNFGPICACTMVRN
ncbi:MAG: hypothetical protein DRR19_16765 [Candidatus Parabeggiatoa sp. nov. 1]|nr:MAG: hypothetical protein DRR19_16765 [Gammaproteobacteria bacterium]